MAGHDAGSSARSRGTRWGSGSPNPDGDVTEATRLLNRVHDELHSKAGKDTWVGAEEFEGAPWWRRPSVGQVSTSPVPRCRLAGGGPAGADLVLMGPCSL